MVHPIKENLSFINSQFKEGTFVLLFSDVYFEMPLVYCHLLDQPISDYFMQTNKVCAPFYAEITEEILNKVQRQYLTSKPLCHSIVLTDTMFSEISKIKKEYLYDPHIHYSIVTNNIEERVSKLSTNPTDELHKLYHDSTKLSISSFSELDYRINVEEKSIREQQNYSTHLKMLSTSLGTDNLFPLQTKETEKIKTSSKTKKIVEENLKKMEIQEKQKESEFTKSTFEKYKQSTDKQSFFDSLKVNPSYKEAKRMLLLLKIEFFYDQWVMEARKEKPNEGKKVEVYFYCFSYLEEYQSDWWNEFVWVIDVLRKIGFEATAHEAVLLYAQEKKKGEKMSHDWKWKTEASPNDNDISFLLKHYGPHLKRSVDSRKDRRVLFEPDHWQVKLLDLIDNDQSVIVSAPTSSGKTFICFYVIHRIISQSDDTVLFILPTKALVNQVSADIYSRFSQRKTKHHLQGQMMPDYSINPFTSQVILTVPSMAEQILMHRKVRYVILDECHLVCENPSVERILHFVTCPIVLLSASIGNIEEFHLAVNEILKRKTNNTKSNIINNKDSNSKDSNKIDSSKDSNKDSNKIDSKINCKDEYIHCIEYKERYCDIKPFVFNKSLIPINTLFAYTYDYIKQYGFTNDLNFLPDEILNLYYSIYFVVKNKSLIQEIRPQVFFKSNILTKRDVILYENYLLTTFQRWVNEKRLSEKEVNKLYYHLTKESRDVFESLKKEIKEKEINEKEINEREIKEREEVYYYTTMNYMLENISLLCDTLKEKGMLPCIIFNTNRRIIDSLAMRLFTDLDSLNIQDNKGKEKLLKEKKRTRDVIEKGKDVWKSKSVQEEEEYALLKERYQCTYTDEKYRLSDYEIKEMVQGVKHTPLIYKSMLSLGIGVHHDGMNKKFRSVIEILFRKRHLQVIFATETLSLGINMPCKTVVFTNDTLYSLQYKQMSGRAGRRGYDLQGNVVFFGVEENKVKNMIISDKSCIVTKGRVSYLDVIYGERQSFIKCPMFYELSGIRKESESNSESDASQCIDLCLNKRESIFNYMKSVLINMGYLTEEGKKTYKGDILVLNKGKEIETMVILYLLDKGILRIEKTSLIEALVHFFGVRRKISDEDVLQEIFCKEEISSLLFYLHNKMYPKTYWITLEGKKDNYILSFLLSNVKKDIKVLYQGLKEISDFIKSLICVYEKFDVERERVRRLKVVMEWFEPKFVGIHA